MRESIVNTYKETSGTMKSFSVVFIALAALLDSLLPLHADESKVPPAPAQITTTVTSKVVTVGSDR